MKKMIAFIFICLCVFTFGSTQSFSAILVEYCVDPGGGGDFTKLQDALDSAETNVAPTNIYLVQGTYTGNFTYLSTQGYSLSIYGGYTAGCGSRDLDPSNTVIDGNNAGKALYLRNTDNGNITVDGITAQNGILDTIGGGLRVVSSTTSGTGDDITITNSIFTNNMNEDGGGIFALSEGTTGAGSITITDNIISGNTAWSPTNGQQGGGIYAESSTDSGSVGTILIQDNTISNNISTDSFGGGAFILSSAANSYAGDITIQGNTFTNNSTHFSGGGIYAESSGESGSGDIDIVGNTCTENSSEQGGGGMLINTETVSGTAGMITIEDNTFTENNAGGTGGGGIIATTDSSTGSSGSIIAQGNTSSENILSGGSGGGMNLQSTGETGTGSISIQNNTIYGNTGGGISVFNQIDSGSGTGGSIIFTDNIVSGNTAYNRAGVDLTARHNDTGSASPITVVNNIITGNIATNNIGAIETKSRNFGTGTTGPVIFTNNTITQNTNASYGNVSLISLDNDVHVYNNIVWGNTGDDFNINAGGDAYGYNNNYSSMSGSWTGGSGNNIDADPKFKSTGSWDDNGTPADTSDDFWVDGDYHLKGSSPCINTGDNSAPGIPAEDFEGDMRIRNNIVDMGADESAKSALSHVLLLLMN